eukprot:scaffold92832_cov27-Tisochrysis_lutea.AAC.2
MRLHHSPIVQHGPRTLAPPELLWRSSRYAPPASPSAPTLDALPTNAVGEAPTLRASEQCHPAQGGGRDGAEAAARGAPGTIRCRCRAPLLSTLPHCLALQSREAESKKDKRSLKLELKELELAHEDAIRELKQVGDVAAPAPSLSRATTLRLTRERARTISAQSPEPTERDLVTQCHGSRTIPIASIPCAHRRAVARRKMTRTSPSCASSMSARSRNSASSMRKRCACCATILS